MSLPRDGSKGHATSAEALHDVLCWLHLIQINLWAHWLQAEGVSEDRHRSIVLVVLICLVGFLQCHATTLYCGLNQNSLVEGIQGTSTCKWV